MLAARNVKYLQYTGCNFIFGVYGIFGKNDVLLAFLISMSTESFEQFCTWFSSTSRGKWTTKAEPSYEGGIIRLKCLHCHQFFPATPEGNGRGWHIGSFITRHLNLDKVCPNQVSEDASSMF